MKTSEERMQIDAFVDGQLELPARLDMERRAVTDATLKGRIDDAKRLSDITREEADYHAAPADFRARMTSMLQAGSARRPSAEQAASQGRSTVISGSMGARLQRWFGWRSLPRSWAASMSVALALVVVGNLMWLRAADDARLGDEVIASHVRSTLGSHLLDVSSSDHHTVKPFLSLKLGFSPPVDELNIPGSSMLGGRVDYLDGQPVAALVYKQGLHVVNAFVWPSRAGDSVPKFSTDKGFRIAHWTQKGMTHWVISDVNREEFGNVVRAMTSAGS